MDYKQKNRDKKILKTLYVKSHQYKDLNQLIIPYLPEQLKKLLVDCSYVSGILTLSFSQQLALSQCRFVLPKLKQQLQLDSFFHSLKKIKPIIATFAYNKQHDKQCVKANDQDSIHRNKRFYSNQSSKLLLDLAESIESEELKNALQRLAEDMKEP